ncbi:unnamed protein product [Mycena citricolor]|uniref:Indoleamine 2,3-dioxygenase n=1 Tax=Mycena citricolor TaxID=2018698 RepID=A0AAD2JV92_9AGAR|nr:unnamed protein product [Mycena citricolor]CAK5279019.1 unnamed protein product [Mycena citricolor]
MNIIDLFHCPHRYFCSAVSLVHSTLFILTRRREKISTSRDDYDIDEVTGFLPPSPPPRLSGPFALWEQALTEARTGVFLWDDQSEDSSGKRLSSEAWRSRILSVSRLPALMICAQHLSKLPVIDTNVLRGNLRGLHRAHAVLAFLTHYFVHSAPPAGSDLPCVVPKALAIPFVTVSRDLGIAPVLTYADTVLWNYELIDAAQPASAINIEYLNTFSGTEDEAHFYCTSAMVELRGVEILNIIDEFASLPDLHDLSAISKLSRDLTRLVGVVTDISDIIQSVRDNVDPHVFYHTIRRWFNGSDANGTSSPGWVYEGVSDSDKLDLSGPSGAQSSIIHALDLFLDVDHKLHLRRLPPPSADNRRSDTGFMERMRRYMPGKHRDYLHCLANSPRSIRELAERTPALREPYDSAVMALKKLRDLHMRIACRYIITMSRSNPSAACPVAAMMDKVQKSRGTGGNELAALLKASRDATRRTLLKQT